MTASKKKTTKKKDLESREAPFWGMILGWFLFAVGIILLLGCVSSVYSGNEGNWLGPFFGGVLPETFTFVFGRLAVILFTLTLALWGLFIALKNVRERLLSFSVGMTLLTVDLSCLMALKNYGETGLSKETLFANGGVVGQFFMQNVFVSVFGKASLMAPLLILLVILALVLVLSFGLRPRHFNFMVKTMRWVTGLFHKKDNGNSEGKASGEVRESREGDRKSLLVDDSTMYSVPSGYNIKDKADIKPFKVRRGMMSMPVHDDEGSVQEYGALAENPYALDDQTTMAPPGYTRCRAAEDATVVASGHAGRGLDALNATASGAANSGAATSGAAETGFGGEDPEILRLEQELRNNERHMSALQIKEIRDKIAAIRHARDVLNWEKAHQNRLVVKGAVRGGENETVNDSAKTVANEPVAANFAEENTAFVGAEQSGYAEPAENAEEETFMPEIVTADEVEQDPTYAGANVIGTRDSAGTSFASGSTGVPQPDPTVLYDEYKVPTVDQILDTHDPQPADYTEDELNEIGHMLEEKLENFKVKGKVVGCETGPVITRFEVEPGPGVKVSQFSALQDDLAMALKATSIRILTPIPGKGAVGIEIPNRKAQTIFGRDIFESDAFKPSPEKIVMALGKDISGEPFTMDLAKAPHLMIAGQTGSGKSVCINALMASMLFSKTPDELRMILVDPKAVELKMYENIPHLLAPVIIKPEIAIQALEWLCYEMDRRTEVLAQAKVRNLLGFNEKFEAGELPEEVPEPDRSHRMAFIVVVIDEMADLMMVAGKEIEKSVSRLAAKARAVGIHLVLATQRPSVKVITGNIKANLPTRISFKVASQVDARTVMDHAGAEKLLGRGDMLFKAVNAPDPVRVHGAFLSDEEAEKLADACSDQNVCYPQLESFDVVGADGDEDGEGNAAMNEKLDKLLFEVAKWAIEVNGLSTSAVQRHFSVGYSRAGKIVDQLYGLGVCGPSKGNSKPRAMLIDMEGLLNLERSGKLG